MSITVAIIGRPNVGKSTLFNRLVGKRLALVDDTPGLTRDRREGTAQLVDLEFTVIDTAGLEDVSGDVLEARMRAQTERALDGADVALLLIDARAGITPLDRHFADWLRRRNQKSVVIANKCEGGAGAAGLIETYALGLGDPIPLSAEHGEGMGDLYDVLAPIVDGAEMTVADEEAGGGPLQLAIVGRPNVGKSTLVNRLLGEDRVVTGPEPGITRDSVSISWTYKGQPIRLIDTAGLRRKSRVEGRPEGLSTADAFRAIRYAQIVVLVLDSQAAMEKQDLTIARQVIEEGRALLIAVNKWDLVSDAKAVLGHLNDRLERSLPQVRGIPILTLSALTGKSAGKVMPAVLDIYKVWNRRISTGRLNQWLADMIEHHPPPLAGGRSIRLRYVTQAKTRPPTFVLFASRPEQLPDSYLRYLANSLRRSFDLPGVPIRLFSRKGKNPYAPS
jgi:GTP-binding protein